MNNAWLLYKKIYSKNIAMLAYIKKTAVAMLASSMRQNLLAYNMLS